MRVVTEFLAGAYVRYGLDAARSAELQVIEKVGWEAWTRTRIRRSRV